MILDATNIYADPRGGGIDVEHIRIRLRVLTLLMRWSGLRIRDAVTLEKTRLIRDNLLTLSISKAERFPRSPLERVAV